MNEMIFLSFVHLTGLNYLSTLQLLKIVSPLCLDIVLRLTLEVLSGFF